MNKKWFKHYAQGREAFEHIDQRLPDEKYEDRIVEITAEEASRKIHYGLSMKKGLFTPSDKSWDIIIDLFKEIKVAVIELIMLIIESSNKAINKDKLFIGQKPANE